MCESCHWCPPLNDSGIWKDSSMFTSFVHVCLVVVSVTIQFPSKSSNTHKNAQVESTQSSENNEMRYQTCLDKRCDIKIVSLSLRWITRTHTPRPPTSLITTITTYHIACMTHKSPLHHRWEVWMMNTGQLNLYAPIHTHTLMAALSRQGASQTQ